MRLRKVSVFFVREVLVFTVVFQSIFMVSLPVVVDLVTGASVRRQVFLGQVRSLDFRFYSCIKNPRITGDFQISCNRNTFEAVLLPRIWCHGLGSFFSY